MIFFGFLDDLKLYYCGINSNLTRHFSSENSDFGVENVDSLFYIVQLIWHLKHANICEGKNANEHNLHQNNISYMCQPKMRAIIVFVFLNQYTGSKKHNSKNIATGSLLLQSGSYNHGPPLNPPINLYIRPIRLTVVPLI